MPIVLDRELVERLRALSRRHGVTLFMTLMAGLQTLLARYLRPDERDIVVGFLVAGRTRRGLDGVVGFFVNPLLLRTDLSDNPSFHELLARVREAALAADAHQELPFAKLVAALNPQRTLSYMPLFQVMLALQEDIAEPVLAGLKVSAVPLHTATAKFDLNLALSATGEGELMGFVEYATDLFDPPTVERLVGHLRLLLEAAVRNPDDRVEQMPMLTESERRQLLIEWNSTSLDTPVKCIHQMVEAQVDRTPDSVAVVFGERMLTYRELDARANRLRGTCESSVSAPIVWSP